MPSIVRWTGAIAMMLAPAVRADAGRGGLAVSELEALLSRGINMDHIVTPYRDPALGWTAGDDERVRSRIRADEFELVAKLGFRHVRLNLGRAFLQEYEPPCRLRPEGFELLELMLDKTAEHGLGTVIDMHQVPVPPLDTDPAQRKGFRELWGAIARHGAKRDQPLVYELLNEPRVEDPDAWREIVAELIGEIRRHDPERPIVVTGGGWGGIADLVKLGLAGQPNLVYSFHFYDPFVFTHQGATWTGSVMRDVKGIHYPLRPEQMRAEKARAERAGGDPWPMNAWTGRACGRDELRELMGPAREFAKAHGALLYCGEFGTIRREWTPKADRARWLTDVRTLLEEAGFGWAMWAYHAGFDLVEDDRPIPEVVDALGLGGGR